MTGERGPTALAVGVAEVCVCHGEPGYWQKDKRLVAGGKWICGVRRRAASRAQYEKVRDGKLAEWRARYDTDPVFRIEKLLSNARIKRRQQSEARRALHAPSPKLVSYLREVRLGPLQNEGRNRPTLERATPPDHP